MMRKQQKEKEEHTYTYATSSSDSDSFRDNDNDNLIEKFSVKGLRRSMNLNFSSAFDFLLDSASSLLGSAAGDGDDDGEDQNQSLSQGEEEEDDDDDDAAWRSKISSKGFGRKLFGGLRGYSQQIKIPSFDSSTDAAETSYLRYLQPSSEMIGTAFITNYYVLFVYNK